jgi:hypothetical protein
MTRYLRAELAIGAAALVLGVVAVGLHSEFLEILAAVFAASTFTLVLARALTGSGPDGSAPGGHH